LCDLYNSIINNIVGAIGNLYVGLLLQNREKVLEVFALIMRCIQVWL